MESLSLLDLVLNKDLCRNDTGLTMCESQSKANIVGHTWLPSKWNEKNC